MAQKRKLFRTWGTDFKKKTAGELYSTKHLGIWEDGGRGPFVKAFSIITDNPIQRANILNSVKYMSQPGP